MKQWLLASTLVLILVGCANSPQSKQLSQLEGLQKALPGVYTSPVAGGAADSDVSFTISQVSAQLIGEKVFFVRETPADNAGLVLWQGIWTFVGIVPKGHQRTRGEPGVMQHSFLFKQPRRWASAGSNPELLVSMLPDDLQPLPGCDLLWQSIPMGYETQKMSGDCRPGRLASGLWIEQQAQLEGDRLTLTEQPLDANGAPDERAAPITLHLTRTGSPP
ncbi:MAG TPA: CpcT/CpeT family chromophore lyase [Steroidobacteraceae bacterium]|nr:CpcT/CpeT family chromophore lyase [Steroidobacteraceae bacterium]